MAMAASRHPDACSRVVAHFDVDCFYAQAEVLRRPSLRGIPVGITQKFLVVTCNYTARALGVPKMVPIEDARKRCPDLVLINGEDLTPYRAASKHIMALLGRFGTVERLGLDEGAVDITAEVKARVASGATADVFSGLVIDSGTVASTQTQPAEAAESRACSELNDAQEGKEVEAAKDCKENSAVTEGKKLLMIGSQLVTEIRAALEKETGFQVSCGIAHNKMLAKMACSVNKPNKQTILLDSAVSGFLAPMSVRKLPGVGHRMQGLLNDVNVETVADLRKVTIGQLSSMFGERIGVFMYHACRGYDPKPVHNKGPPKSLSVEDSFRNCITLKQVEDIMRALAPDLVSRLDEDKAETGRTPKLLTVKWRTKAIMPFTSVSGSMPADLLSATLPLAKRREVAVEAGMRLVSRYFGARPFHMVVLNIGATGFTEDLSGTSPVGDIRHFLQTPGKSPMKLASAGKKCIDEGMDRESQQKGATGPCEGLQVNKQRALISSLKVVSKREARIRREGHFVEEASPSYGNDWKFDVRGLSTEGRDGFTSDLSENSDEDEGEANWLDGSTSSLGWKDTTRSFDGQVKGARHPFDLQKDGTSRERAEVDPPDKQADSLYEGQKCKRCGQIVEGNEQGRQEHADYHFALSLQEDNAGSKLTPAMTPGSGHGNTSRERPRAHPSPTCKRPKSRNGTLDGFVVRR